MMKSPLFNWQDLRRIAKSVFNDVPENDLEILAWTETVLFLCTTVKTVLRQLGDRLGESLLYDGVLQMIQASIEELLRSLDMFSSYRLEMTLNWIYENVIAANLGYIKVLSEKEIEK